MNPPYDLRDFVDAIETIVARHNLGRPGAYVCWGLNDLHALFGALCCLADLQTALPGLIRTERPPKLVLDRRPFI